MGLVFFTILVCLANSSSSKELKSADSSIIFVPPTCPMKQKNKKNYSNLPIKKSFVAGMVVFDLQVCSICTVFDLF